MGAFPACPIDSRRTADTERIYIMVKSMFAAVAGLRTHQAKMDVIGNNIANVNTYGYKAGSVSFQDTMYQTTASGSSGNTAAGGTGGTNSNQVGYGVTTGSISYDFSKGGMSASSSGLDCMINSDNGFFIVGPMIEGGSLSLDDTDAIKSSGLYLSRVGSFSVDANGYLTDSSGNYVYGFINSGDLTSSTDIATSVLAPLQIPSTADLADVNNNNAATQVANAKKTLEEARVALNSLNVALGTARENYIEANEAYTKKYGEANIAALQDECDSLEDAVDTAYANWVDSPEDPDLKADYYEAKLAYDKKNYELIQAKATVRAPEALATYTTTQLETALDNYETALTAFASADSSDSDYDTKKEALATARTALEEIETALTKIEDNSPEGLLSSAKQTVDAAEAKVIAAETAVTNAEKALAAAQSAATSTSVGNSNADDTLASFSSYSIETDGTVIGITSDNVKVIIGKIALANVQNTGGLEKTSGYYYSIGSNAGNVSVHEADNEILGNYLELSTVDLATEMTEMITTQRGFQANSKIITVTDTMLEELVNMKR